MGKPRRPPKPKLGRPARAGSAATEVLGLRLTLDELASWRQAAGDTPLGAWVRTICNTAAKRSNERRN